MSDAIERLNALSSEAAEAELREVCGAPGWAAAVSAARPFPDRRALADAAEAAWSRLSREAWLAGFAAHPRIGEGRRRSGGEASAWSRAEQAGLAAATDGARAELAEAQREYERRFGWPYIVCASGRSADEMLADCRARLANDPDDEIHVAADEERSIGRLRLEKLLTDRRSGMRISTHVLDVTRGRPAAGVGVLLSARTGEGWREIARGTTDTDGRARFDDEGGGAGAYRLRFETGDWFRGTGVPAFWPHVEIAFEVIDPAEQHHVPLLLSPYGYSTYRGS